MFGSGVYALQIIIPIVGVIIALLLAYAVRHTRLGKVLQACVQNPNSAQLMGINVGRVVAASFAVSTVLAAIAGILIAPLFAVHSDMGTLFGLKAFAVAILGGITSASGVFTAGIIFGLVEAIVTVYLGSAFTQIITFTLVIFALAVKPNGLFVRGQEIKV
ncbi:branched-chain amino acid ABC transporter permease [Vibrio sp. M60_M31a]